MSHFLERKVLGMGHLKEAVEPWLSMMVGNYIR
jgi:hypothetical protein